MLPSCRQIKMLRNSYRRFISICFEFLLVRLRVYVGIDKEDIED